MPLGVPKASEDRKKFKGTLQNKENEISKGSQGAGTRSLKDFFCPKTKNANNMEEEVINSTINRSNRGERDFLEVVI